MDKAAAIRCVKQYADLVRQNFDVKKIILYGSFSRDAARKDSDIHVLKQKASVEMAKWDQMWEKQKKIAIEREKKAQAIQDKKMDIEDKKKIA